MDLIQLATDSLLNPAVILWATAILAGISSYLLLKESAGFDAGEGDRDSSPEYRSRFVNPTYRS